MIGGSLASFGIPNKRGGGASDVGGLDGKAKPFRSSGGGAEEDAAVEPKEGRAVESQEFLCNTEY